MTHQKLILLLPLLAAVAAPSSARAASGKYSHSPCTPKSKLPGCVLKSHSTELQPYTPKKHTDNGLKDRMTEAGRRARGFYITAYWMSRIGAKKTAQMMKRANMTAVVIDMKDDFGQITYPSKIPLARRLAQRYVKDPAEAAKIFHEHGIYVIGRVVCFKDSRLPYHRPDLAVRIGPRAERLFSAGANWIDHYSAEVQDYLVDIALELQSFGFDEVQFDYIRFPKGFAGTLGRWLHAEKDKRDRSTLIASFLEKVDRALTIPISVDIYGLTTLVDGDPRSLGQTIEQMAKYVDGVSPMMYANGMRTYFKGDKVTERVYSIIHCGLWRARHKAPGIVLRPYLQAYPDSVQDFFGHDFIKKQVLAAERAGSNGFLFWNAGMRNGVAYAALQQMGKHIDAFGSDVEQYKTPSNNPGAWCPQQGMVFGGNGKNGAASRKAKGGNGDGAEE
jgi:hypothetical protein